MRPESGHIRETTVAAGLILDLVRYLEQQGVPLDTTYRSFALDPLLLEIPNARLPGSLVERAWEQASRLADDPDVGLHSAENFNPGALNILGYVLMSCRTAAEALGRLGQFAALVNDGMRVHEERDGARIHCRFEVVPNCDNYLARAPRHAMETMACGTLITMRRLTTRPIAPLSVTFQHARPARIEEHVRIFGEGIVKFGHSANGIEFRRADLEQGLLSANPALLAMFDLQAQELLAQIDRNQPERGTTSRRVLAILTRRITAAVPSVGDVALELAMSERSLQRELREEGTSFRQLIEDVRKEIALRHLAQPGALASEAAFLLGFSEPGAFTRAFRRWTGASPTQFQSA
ncbi:MAG: AraC family transcriptional regulator [Bryobacterales bacterium]|nr:AraC family transcriptional regulator [Bryobacterales bacterium]